MSLPKAFPGPSAGAQQPPIKRVLLQKEDLQTFDKTWLPARLSPPSRDRMVVTDGRKDPVHISYEEYLADYHRYLHALQHMKREHLALTRRDNPKVPRPGIPAAAEPVSAVASLVPTLKSAVNAAKSFGFGSVPANQKASDLLDKLTSAITTVESAEAPSGVLPTEPLKAATPPSAEKQAARKAARRARQRAAAKAKALAKKADDLASQATLAQVAVQAAKAKSSQIRSERTLKKVRETFVPRAPKVAQRKKESPSRVRRREKRAAARAAQGSSAT